MQSIDFIGGKAAKIENLEDLKPRELLYIRLHSMLRLDIVQKVFIKKACQATSQVILSIPFEDFKNKEARTKLLELGVKGFALRLNHSPDIESGDNVLIETFKMYDDLLPVGKDLIAEFQCGEDLRGLAATIAEVHAKGSKWVVLNVEGGPTPEISKKFIDVFEKLKIRGCSRLNIYFPFWNQHSAAWDMNTLNTFAGLQYVHIDISNRCTHSCAFCGLYGPDSVFDQKMRAGGSMPEELTQFMNKEMDPVKCLEIIESLPWTVKSIQFGGVGDPLIHPQAMQFITAARERGFQIEILTNSEYLNEEDLLKLHSLGGKTLHDLHFIANISGGTSEIYIKTRPKQNEGQFDKVVGNLTRLSELRNAHPRKSGAAITVMCVVTKENSLHLKEVAELAKKIGASRLWFKPLEVHSSHHARLLPLKEQMKEVSASLIAGLKIAEENNIEIVQRDYCESIIRESADA